MAEKLDKIHCIRFIKLPPSAVHLNVPFELAVSICDDVGSPLPDYGSLGLRLQCFTDDCCLQESAEYEIVEDKSKSSQLSIDSSFTTYHSFKALLRRRQTATKAALRPFRLCISLDADACKDTESLQSASRSLCSLLNEKAYVHLDSYEQNFLMLRACSEPIQIKPTFMSLNKDKVRHTEVLLHPAGSKIPLRIMERPSMHVIGDHLWHSSLVMASFILNQKLDENTRPETGFSTLFLELGAGCGLISLAAALAVPRTVTILATDISEIVETTLAETLSANSHLSISSEPFRWGETLPEAVQQHRDDIIILASDVLYNKESHQDFLKTLLDVFSQCSGTAQAFVTYKHRVVGDEGFFEMARKAGLELSMIHQVADVQIWHCKPR